MTRGAWARWLLLCCALALGSAWAQPTPADALHSRFASIRGQRTGQLAGRAVYLQSTEASDRMQGDVYALVERPYAELRNALVRPGPWCDILILHLNVKYCRVVNRAGHDELVAGIGRKFDQPLAKAYWVRFTFHVSSASDAYLELALQAPTGPLGTQDYRLVAEAVPYTAGQTLLHMRYAYSYGLAARWAMQAYLATIGSDKRGFSVVGLATDGAPLLVGGVRGVLERNTLRYYLAIESYLEALRRPAPEQRPTSLRLWFDATERYAAQLHEIDRDAYLAMKQRELHRQETEAPPP
jgi:hypothetical protein